MTDVIPGSPATATLRRRLTELGETGRTGALHVGGRPGGVLYLVTGRIAYAETPACPGLGDQLVAGGRVSALRVVATIADAAGELLQAETEGPVRFVPGERHWLGDMTTRRPRGVPGKRKPALR